MFIERGAACRLLGSAAFAFLALGMSARAATRLADLAPADEYFGRAHMSPIEVSNRIRHGEELAKRDRFAARRSASTLLLTQDAIEAWARRYPRDPWIVRDERKLTPLFADLETSEGDRAARRCGDVLARSGNPQVIASLTRPDPRARRVHPRHTAHVARRARTKKKHRRLLGFL